MPCLKSGYVTTALRARQAVVRTEENICLRSLFFCVSLTVTVFLKSKTSFSSPETKSSNHGTEGEEDHGNPGKSSLKGKNRSRGDFSSWEKKKLAIWRPVVDGFKASAIFALGFYTGDALIPNSKNMIEKQAKLQGLKVQMDSLEEGLEVQMESLKESTDKVKSSYKQLEKRVENLERRQQQWVEIRKKKLSGVSYEEMDQKKRSDLVQRMKAEYGIFKN